MTQIEKLTFMLMDGWTTPIEALHKCGVYRFSARINELKRKYHLEEKWMAISVKKPKKIKAFRITKQKNQHDIAVNSLISYKRA